MGAKATVSREKLREVAFSSPAGLIAFGLGSGLAPVAPGTVGTLAAMPLGWGLLHLPPLALVVVLLVSFLIGIWACGQAGRSLNSADHGAIVIDEWLGIWLVMAFLPATLWGYIAAFVLFRLFDIVKPWPIRWLDQRIKGGTGVMLDDLVAAIFAIATYYSIESAGQWLNLI